MKKLLMLFLIFPLIGNNQLNNIIVNSTTNNRLFYYFHAGQSTTPFTTDLTGAGPFYIDGGNGETTDLSVAMQDMIANAGNQYYGPMGSFTMANGLNISANGNVTQWTYPTTTVAEPFYLAVPNNSDFPEDLLTGNHLVNLANGFPTNAASMALFTCGFGFGHSFNRVLPQCHPRQIPLKHIKPTF